MTFQIDLTGVAARVIAALIIAALTALGAALWPLARAKYQELKQRVGQTRLDQLTDIARRCALIAEQSGLATFARTQMKLLGAQKKAIALAAAQAYADHIGLKVDIQQLDAEIEHQVSSYNWNKLFPPDPLAPNITVVPSQVDDATKKAIQDAVTEALSQVLPHSSPTLP